MNWSDYVVLGIIVGFGIIGLLNGFVFSIFKIASFFISIIISVKFYPVVSEMLAKTPFYNNIKDSILKNLLLQNKEYVPAIGNQVKANAAETVINRLPLPDFFKQSLADKIPNPSEIIDTSGIMNTISEEIAKVVISILSLVLLYFLVRIGLVLVGFILRGITKLPVVKQMDKFGGFAFGAAEGIFTVYILCAILMLFNTVPQFGQVFDLVDKSIFAKTFYQNNFIVNWMFPGA
jgi:uncharacterized membrane protein required for colicin V production